MLNLFRLECPKCKGEFNLEHELTVQGYLEAYTTTVPIEELKNNLPEWKPDYVVYRCDNPDCGHTEKLNNVEVLERLKICWAKEAWNMAKCLYQTMESFDAHFTRHTLENELSKTITEAELESNPILKRYKIMVENAKRKHT